MLLELPIAHVYDNLVMERLLPSYLKVTLGHEKREQQDRSPVYVIVFCVSRDLHTSARRR